MKKKYRNYFFIGLLVLLLFISYSLIKPFITAIITSILLSYLFYPLYKKMNLFIKNKAICSFVFIISITSISATVIFLVTNALISESINMYSYLKNIKLNVVIEHISEYTGNAIDIQKVVDGTINILIKPISNFAFSVPEKLIGIFIAMFMMYYFLQEGENIVEKLKKVIPIKTSYKNILIKKFHSTVYATFYGVIITGVIQGAVGTLGLYIFKVQSPILWGVVMTLLAILPYVGPSFVWLPASLYKIFTGDLFNGFGLLIYSLLITSTIDNFIRPHLISRKTNVHPIIILLGIIGGLKMFGFIGIITGPIILTILYALFEFYVIEYGSKD